MGIRSFLARRKKPKSSSPTESSKEIPFRSLSISSDSDSKTQIEDLEHVFKRFDVNGDGKISWSELGLIMGNLGYKATEEELQKMMKIVDSDGDGFIDLNEFIELNTNGVDSVKELEDLRNAFLVYDLDRNGSISPEELQKVLRNLGDDSSIEDCKKMISGVDCDGDGSINFEEFKIMMMGSGFSQSTAMISPTRNEEPQQQE